MIEEKKVVAIIPARGGSKRIPRKNIRLVNNKPLIYYTIGEAKKSRYIDRLIVSTEDSEIKSVVESYDTEVIDRPPALAKGNTRIIDTIKQVLDHLKKYSDFIPDIVVLTHATNPLRKIDCIDKCISELVNNDCDTVMTVTEVVNPPQWMCRIEKGFLDFIYEKGVPFRNRQEYETLYMPNNAVNVMWLDTITKKDSFVDGCKIKPVIMNEWDGLDIDTDLELFMAEELLIKGGRKNYLHD